MYRPNFGNFRRQLWIRDCILERIQLTIGFMWVAYLLLSVRHIFIISEFLHKSCLQSLATNWVIEVLTPGIHEHICLTFFHEAFQDLAAGIAVVEDPVHAIIMLILDEGDVVPEVKLADMRYYWLQGVFVFAFIFAIMVLFEVAMWEIVIMKVLIRVFLDPMYHVVIQIQFCFEIHWGMIFCAVSFWYAIALQIDNQILRNVKK